MWVNFSQCISNHRSIRLLNDFPLISSTRVEVILGAPSKQCSGAGICHVLSLRERSDRFCRCNSVMADLSINSVDQASFSFCLESMNQAMNSFYFSSPFFYITEAVSLSKLIAKELGIVSGTIFPGIYPILRNRERVLVATLATLALR